MKDDQMNRRTFLSATGKTLAAAGLVSAAGCMEPAAQRSAPSAAQADTGINHGKPNVIVIMIDQLRCFSMGCYGNDVIRTPHMDRLAGQGARFEYAVTNNPVCMPARSALLSGRFSRTCQGFLDNYIGIDENGNRYLPQYPVNQRDQLKDPTLPEHLKDAGYRTCLIGKWHIHPAPQFLGFDEFVYPQVQHRHLGQTFINHRGEKFVPDQYSPDYEADQVQAFLSRPHDKPFFLFYNISPPHIPLADAPEKYTQMYRPKDMPLRENVYPNGKMARDEEWFKIYLWDFLYYKHRLPHTLNLPEGFNLRHLTAAYYGATTWTDDLVGRTMKSLKDNNLDKNTIVVLLSDHGDNLGSHGTWNKQLLYEESIRIPLLVRGPGIRPKQVQSGLVAQTVDIMPTVLDLCGRNIPQELPGRNLAPMLTQNAPAPTQKEAYIEITAGRIGIRTTTHLYGIQLADDLKAIEDDRYCFYDLRTDPFQMNNLAKTGQQADLAEELCAKLIAWHETTPWLGKRMRSTSDYI